MIYVLLNQTNSLNLSNYQYIYQTFNLFIKPSINLSNYQSIKLAIHQTINLSNFQTIKLSKKPLIYQLYKLEHLHDNILTPEKINLVNNDYLVNKIHPH